MNIIFRQRSDVFAFLLRCETLILNASSHLISLNFIIINPYLLGTRLLDIRSARNTQTEMAKDLSVNPFCGESGGAHTLKYFILCKQELVHNIQYTDVVLVSFQYILINKTYLCKYQGHWPLHFIHNTTQDNKTRGNGNDFLIWEKRAKIPSRAHLGR